MCVLIRCLLSGVDSFVYTYMRENWEQDLHFYTTLSLHNHSNQ